jgi:hypothetical protein
MGGLVVIRRVRRRLSAVIRDRAKDPDGPAAGKDEAAERDAQPQAVPPEVQGEQAPPADGD